MHSFQIGRRDRRMKPADRLRGLGAGVLLPVILAACGSLKPAGPVALTLLTHDSFAVSDSVLKGFEQEAGVKVDVLQAGDAGAVLNKAVLTKAAPLADVLFGVDNAFLTRALEEGIFEPYESPLVKDIPAEFRLDPENRALPVDYGDVCVNYDRRWFADRGLPIPKTLEELADPQYAGLLAVENPFTSSPGLAFLLATVAHFGPDGFAEYWRSLKKNGVQVADGWETAYYTDFSASSGKGPQPLVVSYASSPAFEFLYADPPVAEPPTGSLLGPDMCFRQIEFVGILAGTKHRAQAERLVDFLLSVPFQEDIPVQMAVFPVNPQAALPDAFVRFAQVPAQPATLAPDRIAAHREEWLNAWKAVMLP